MKFCNQCGFANSSNARFCQECGHSLQSRDAARTGGAVEASARHGENSAGIALPNLSQCVAQARVRLKELKQPIPPASSDAVALLMGRLQTIAPDDFAARIEVIDALGRTRDPVVLRALLLVAGAGSKNVRRAVAVALSGINHTLSAYILLPMLEDQSSRVRNSAIQALIYINQPHTTPSIISACLGNRELRRIAFDTMQRLRPMQRESFINQLSQENLSSSIAASDLVREFRSVADAISSAGPVNTTESLRESVRSPEVYGHSDSRAFVQTNKSPRELHPSTSLGVQSESRTPERQVSKASAINPGLVPQSDRQQPAASTAASGEARWTGKVPAASQLEMPLPPSLHDRIVDSANDEMVSRPMFVRPADDPADYASRGMEVESVRSKPESAVAPRVRFSQTSDEFMNHGIDVASLDDLAVSRLMAELVPETPGVRSSDSVADFRFFESVSTDLNDSRGDWPSPENSVFDYGPAPGSVFSDTQSFSTQNTNPSDFALSPNAVANSFGSSASGRIPQMNPAGSSASWSVQPPLSPVGYASPISRAMNPVAGDPSRSGSHVLHPSQSLPATPAGPLWSSASQNQAAPAYPNAQMYQGGMHAPIHGLTPQHFTTMTPQMAMPPTAFSMPQMPVSAFSPMVPDPAISVMNLSGEIATFSQTSSTAVPVVSAVSQSAVANADPLSKAVLLNGGTLPEIPMLPATGITVGTTAAQSSAPIELTVSTTARVDGSEQAEKKAQAERNLERLRKARDHAFRVLLENQEPISGTVPRLISKKITTLLTTPGGDHAQIKQQLVALGKTGSPHVLETLASFCQKPVKELRISCAEALGFVKHQGAVVQLLKFLGDKSGTVIDTALKSMISLQDKAAYPVILAAGMVNSSLRTIVSSSIETLAEEFKPTWEQQLLSCLNLDDPDLVAFSIQMLVKLTGATHVDSFLSFAGNSEAIIRAAAIEALVKTGAKKVIGTINEALEDQDPLVRAQAATAVGTLHSPRSIDLLGKLLLDPNVSVRRSAAQSAARIEEPDLGDAIVAALKEETDHLVIEYLLEALNKNGGKTAYSLLVQFVEGTDSELREIALKALRRLKLQESVPVFTRLLDDKHPHIRKQAVEQLALLKFNGAIPRLKQMVKADTDEHVRGACARSLGDLQDQTSLDLLEAALEDHPVVRFQAVLALGKIGNSAAGPSLLALLRDPLPEVRYQAVRALGHLKLEGSEVHLEPLLQDSDVMVRRGVEQTLQEFGMSVSQIRRMRILKAFSKAMLAISPSYIFAALPGKAGSAVAALTMFLLLGGVWLLSNVGTFVNGSSVLPVFRVENVRISSAADLAVVWRKELVFDVARATTGKLLARIQCSVGTREVIVENKGGVIVLAGKTLKRLRPEDEFEPSLGTSKDLGAIPLGISFHPRNNLCCLFMPNGQGTQLQLYNGETLETVASHDIKGRFDGRCLVSPDMKMGLSLNAKGELSIAELASGEVFSLNVSDLVKSDKIGKTRDVQFSTDMKHVCFSTTENLFIFSVNSMTLQKQIQEAGGFFATSSSEEGLLRAVSSEGKIVEISPDLSNVTEKDIGHYFNLVDVDPGGKLIIIADTDARDANVFDIQQQKIVSTIAGE